MAMYGLALSPCIKQNPDYIIILALMHCFRVLVLLRLLYIDNDVIWILLHEERADG